MLCQHCKQREANTHIVKTVGNKRVELFLCPVCAKAGGYTSGFSISDFLFGDMMSSAFAPTASDRCPECGTSFGQISKKGTVGCGKCYEHFREKLMPTVSSLHSSPVHKGKTPKGAVSASKASAANEKIEETPKKKTVRLTKEKKIEKLKGEQREAIAAENFEKAAELRDKIKKLEGGSSND